MKSVIILAAFFVTAATTAHSETILQKLRPTALHESVENTFTSAPNKNIVVAQAGNCSINCRVQNSQCHSNCTQNLPACLVACDNLLNRCLANCR